MKRTIFTVLATLAAVGLVMFATGHKAQIYSSSTAIAAPAPVPMAVPIPPRCPNIHEAIQQLQAAEGTLRNAAHDFCGHKRDAMEAVHGAIEQLRQAENCDRCR